MSYTDMAAIFNAATVLKRLGISPTEMLVYLALANRKNEKAGRCDPSIATLAGDCQLNERSVRRAIATLRDRGLIATKDSGFGNRYYRHRFQYELLIPTLDTKPTVENLERTESPSYSGQSVTLPRTQSPSTPDTKSDEPRRNLEENQEEEPSAPPQAFSQKKMAKQITEALGISNRFVEQTLVDVCGFALKVFPGKSEEQVCSLLIEARKEYEEADAAGQIMRLLTAERFFGDGLWKDKNQWNWSPGYKPASKLKTIDWDELLGTDDRWGESDARQKSTQGASAARVERTLAHSRAAAEKRRGIAL